MRDIKFRAWDSRDKKMYYQSNLVSFHFSGREGWVCWNELNTPRQKCVAGCGIEDDVLMQFTGLKDKNGTEIYERDILIDNNKWGEEHHPTFRQQGDIVKVVWLDSEAEYMFENITNPVDGHMIMSANSQLEIIGNIHQNPKLIREN